MSLSAVRAIRLGRLDTAGSHLAEGTASPGTVMTRAPTYVASCCTLRPVLHRYPFYFACIELRRQTLRSGLDPFSNLVCFYVHTKVWQILLDPQGVAEKEKRSSSSCSCPSYSEYQVHSVRSGGLCCNEFIHTPFPFSHPFRIGPNQKSETRCPEPGPSAQYLSLDKHSAKFGIPNRFW